MQLARFCVLLWSWLAGFKLLPGNVWDFISKAWETHFQFFRAWREHVLVTIEGDWRDTMLLGGTLPSSCFSFFLPITCSFALPISDISDRATEVIPASWAVTDMVTYSRLTLQDIIAPKAPAFSSSHLWNLSASCMTPQQASVRLSQPLWSCFDFCRPPTLLLFTAETCTSSSSNWCTTAVGSLDTGLVLLEEGRTSLLPCFWGGEVCRFGRCRHFLHREKKWKRWNREFWAPAGHPSHRHLVPHFSNPWALQHHRPMLTACSCSQPFPGQRSMREGCQQMSDAFTGGFSLLFCVCKFRTLPLSSV